MTALICAGILFIHNPSLEAEANVSLLRPPIPPVAGEGELGDNRVRNSTPSLADLPIFFGGSTRMNAQGIVELISYFNEIAGDEDGYVVTEASLLSDPVNHVAALAQIQGGLRVQNLASWQTAGEQIDLVSDSIDVISYDLELWEQSRDEWEDISTASHNMASIAHGLGLQYTAHLSYQLANRNATDSLSIEHMAEYADAYMVTAYACLERMGMSECIADTREMILRAKSGNPDVRIYVGVSVEKDLALEQLIEYLEGNLLLMDGISIFAYGNRPDSVQRLQAFIQMLRPGSVPTPTARAREPAFIKVR